MPRPSISSTAAPRRCSAPGSSELLPADRPLFALIENVRPTGHSVSEYGVTLETPRLPASRIVTIQAAPLAETAGRVVVMLQERRIADKIDRQLDPPQRRALGHGHGGDAGA